MKKDNKSKVGMFIRGGQKFSLDFHMFTQNLKNQIKYLLVITAAICAISAWNLTTPLERKYTLIWAQSYANTQVLSNSRVTTVINIGGKEQDVSLTWGAIYSNPDINKLKNGFYSKMKISMWLSLFGCFLVIIGHSYFLYRQGKKAVNDEYIRGAKLASKKELVRQSKELIRGYRKERGESLFTLCGVPLVQGQECSGIATVGSPGVGKSETFIDIALQLRQQKRKTIVYDIGGQMAKKFYREGIDHILNPFDARCESWDVWTEGRDKRLYRAVAEALIPESEKSDPIWYQGPRVVLVNVIKKLGERSSVPEMSHLCRILFQMDAKKLSGVLADTQAKSIFNTDAEKTAASIQSILGTYTECFTYLNSQPDGNFSITDWVNNEDDDSWLFITCKENDKALLAPLITVWFELFSKAVLSLEPSFTRRIGCLIDEIPTLQRIPSLETALNTGRKYGLMPVIGYQATTQMEQIYGDKRAHSIISAIPSYVAFRCNGDKAATASAAELGKLEIQQANEGSTVGQTDMRDANSVNRASRDNKQLVLPSEIQALMDLECFLRLGRGLPISKLLAVKHSVPDIASPYMEADFNTLGIADNAEPIGAEIQDIDAYLDGIEQEVESQLAQNKQFNNVASQAPSDSQNTQPQTEESTPVIM